MVVLLRNGSGKLVLFILFLVVALFVIRQLSTGEDFVFTGELSESLDIITGCMNNASKTLEHSAGVEDTRLPNIIHQIWKTADVRTYSTEVEASHESWQTMFSPLNYTVKLWTDDDVRQLLRTQYAWLLPTYDGYPQNIQRADLARLVVVHAEGGIYADLDVYPSDALRTQCLQHLGPQGIFASTAGTLGLSNHFFMAERESSFLQWALREAKRRGGMGSRRFLLPYLQVFWTTGPMMLTTAFREYAWLYNTQRQNIGLLDEAYGRSVMSHAAGRSWHGVDGKVLNYIADHVQTVVLTGVFVLVILFGVAWAIRRRCSRYRELFAYHCLSKFETR